MSRTQATALVAAIVLAAACRVLSTEEQLLARFFEAGRFYDRAAMDKVAAVEWNPASAGIVRDFRVSRVDRETESRRAVTVNAEVRQPDGSLTRREYVAVIERRGGRWLITQLRASRTSPAASSAPPN
jgi:hypothetical protein